MSTPLEALFEKVRAEKRAALIAYIPAGFPSIADCHKVIKAFVDGGVDAIEIGFPYSDPVMDGPTIQAAAVTAINHGTKAQDVLDALQVASQYVPSVVMTYWNPIEKYGADAFAQAIKSHGGSGVIHPDLTIDEARPWIESTRTHDINSIFVVAPSSTDSRLAQVSAQCSGFIYAASIMGVTGARTQVSSGAHELVSRVRAVSTLPIAVGLGVSTREQARDVAQYADGVIVGSAFVKALFDNVTLDEGLSEVTRLARELSLGVRGQ